VARDHVKNYIPVSLNFLKAGDTEIQKAYMQVH